MNKKILVLGGTGMLGSAVASYFALRSGYETTVTYRTEGFNFPCTSMRFDALSDPLESLPDSYEYVINCIGIIKPFMAVDIISAIKLNSIFPHSVARWCNISGMNFIHITTDCVFSGNKGGYIESDAHDALDDYGKTKSLGECSTNAMVLRTSIIGEEIHKNASLIEWVKSQRGKTVSGFSTHLWNGVTTNEYARVCDMIISSGLYEQGIFHIFAQDDVTKF